MSLYRTEALKSRQSKFYGELLITRPLSLSVLTLGSCAAVIALVCFLLMGKYTQKQRVAGVIVPDKGLVKVFAAQTGTVVSLQAKEGEHVTRGQLLYSLRTERINGDGLNTQVAIHDGLAAQQNSLVEEGHRQLTLNEETVASIRGKLAGYHRELEQFADALALVDQQIDLSDDNVTRYETAAAAKLVSEIQLQDKRAESLRLRSSRISLTRERAALERQIDLAAQELATAELQGKNQLALIDRNEKVLQQNMLEADSRSEIRVTAPVSGTVTAILVKPGQTVAGGPLLSILPEGSVLQAELYAPSSAVSFIRNGNGVLLRFLAFPYQKFGQQHAQVVDVSRAAVSVDELRASAPTGTASSAQVYRVTVALPKQTIRAYGKEEPIQPGMEIEADLLLDTRHLYEWLLEPLYSIAGKA